MEVLAQDGLRLDAGPVDYLILAVYFVFVLGIGLMAKRSVSSSLDFFLSGRSLPAWVTGLAFISANLGAIELLGMAANGAQYGIPTMHYYWIGAVPAMVFLGLVMMPFYYGSKVRGVPEYLRLRFNRPTHFVNALTFAVASVLIAGVNLFALALVVNALLGWSLSASIVAAALVVLAYTTLGGLSAAVYNEVLQFFVIVAFLTPLTITGLVKVGGWDGLVDRIGGAPLGRQEFDPTSAWSGSNLADPTGPSGRGWESLSVWALCCPSGVLDHEFRRGAAAMSAKSMGAAQRTPLIGAFSKLLIPFVIIIPGMIAAATVQGIGGEGELQYNNALQLLMRDLLPNGMLGIAITGLLASFMAGMAANISSFNTVFTYDLWETYVVRDRPDRYYLNVGRMVIVLGTIAAVGAAYIARQYGNTMDYIQTLFSFFNAPLFATFIIGLFWKRMTGWAGFAALITGTIGAILTDRLAAAGVVLTGLTCGGSSRRCSGSTGWWSASGACAPPVAPMSRRPAASTSTSGWGRRCWSLPQPSRRGCGSGRCGRSCPTRTARRPATNLASCR